MKIQYQKLKNPGTRVILRLFDHYEDEDGFRMVQEALNLMGKDIEVDGDIGPITIAAIKSVDNRELHQTIEDLMLGKVSIQDDIVTEPFWLDYAYQELGVHEIPGRSRNNKRILQYHAVSGGFSTDEVPWCASFINFIMLKAGYQGPPHPAAAKSWLKFGKSAGGPVLGSIADKSRKGGGHVTFVVGRDRSGDYLYCLGGNQSDSVCIKKYPTRVFIDFRIPLNYQPSQDTPIYKGIAEAAGKES